MAASLQPTAPHEPVCDDSVELWRVIELSKNGGRSEEPEWHGQRPHTQQDSLPYNNSKSREKWQKDQETSRLSRVFVPGFHVPGFQELALSFSITVIDSFRLVR